MRKEKGNGGNKGNRLKGETGNSRTRLTIHDLRSRFTRYLIVNLYLIRIIHSVMRSLGSDCVAATGQS